MTATRSALFFMFGAIGFLMLLIGVFHVPPHVAALLLIGTSVSVMAYLSTKHSIIKAKLTIPQKAILIEFDFYKTLNKTERAEFERRVSYLIQDKEFMGRQNLVVTDRMKVLIAATLAQIAFGFEFISFEDFDKIIIFPKAYYSQHTGHYHKGEVNSSGIIMLSWEDFLEGFRIADDGYNVGLHEIAHALRIEDAIPGNEYHFLKDSDLAVWNALAEPEYDNIRAGKPSFIRSYAGTNRQEFFAVCVEQFFEQPQDFHDTLPQLYNAMAKLLKQNPLKRKR
ncbi:MAG TPA: zinc-dependent peptidase [Cytophagaceae bacterium]|jgi:Mlc titration factor MtfA (ptsG expression regulator)|nr:zinc-dependent peptidase [Cytophagaceae bacterium]